MNEYFVRLNGKTKKIKVLDEHFVEIDNFKYRFELTEIVNSKYLLKIEDRLFETSYIKNAEDNYRILIDNASIDVNIKTALQEKAYLLLSESQSTSNHQTTIKSPMPGLVVKILKKEGDNIIKGEAVMILEAMKMENEIKATINGIISKIFVEQGKPIEKNISLFSLK